MHLALLGATASSARQLCCCDSTRLSLLLAWCGGLGLTLRDVIFTYQQGCSVHRRYGFRTFCVVEILDTIFLLPCTIQLLYLVATYREKEQQKLRELAEAAQQLAENRRKTINEQHDIFVKGAKANIEWTEKLFFEQRRDFLRYVNELQQNLPGGSDLLLEIRRFILVWIRIYTETFWKKDSQDLQHAEAQLEESEDLADLLQRTKSLLQDTNFRISLDAFDVTSDVRSLQESLEPPVQVVQSMVRGCPLAPDWLQVRPSCRCQMDEESIHCCFCHVDLLNSSHGLLLVSLVAGSCLVVMNLVLYLFSARTTQMALETLWDLSPLLLYLLSLTLILLRFERICLLEKRHDHWQEMRQQQCIDFYEKLIDKGQTAQRLVDLWNERTLPRLELLKGLHCRLSLLPQDELRVQLQQLNVQLQGIEDAVGDVGSWWQAQQQGRQVRPLRPSVDKLLRGLSYDGIQQFPEHLVRLRDEMADDAPGAAASDPGLELTAAAVEVKEAAAPRNLDSFCASEASGGPAGNVDSFVAEPRNLDSFLR